MLVKIPTKHRRYICWPIAVQKTNNLAKKPENGGMPEIEKKVIKKGIPKKRLVFDK